ncbi:MAG: ATPase [Planctomycetota bacterium]
MSDLSIDPNRHVSLAILVETVTSPMLMSHPAPICLEVDIDPDIPIPASVESTTAVIRSMTKQILAELDQGGDLLITGCKTESSIELELADDGPAIENRARSVPIAVAEAGADLKWQDCPQGGAAVTVSFPFVKSAGSHSERSNPTPAEADRPIRKAA